MTFRGTTIVFVTVCTLIACDRTKPQDESSPAQPESVTNTSATMNAPSGGVDSMISKAGNAASVTRYVDESAMAPTTSKLVPATTARTMPLGPRAVAIFESGGDVTVLAKRGSYYLVIFPDPKDAQKQLAGWIYKDGIGLVGAASTSTATASDLTCKNGEVHVLADGLCALACTHDADCAPAGGVCDGNGLVASVSHSVSRAQYCVVAPQ
jgi:hypothetical protein